MGEEYPIRVLFDNSLYRFCQSDDVVVPPVERVDGRVNQRNRLPEVRKRRPRAGEEWKFEQIPSLSRICDLARSGYVQFAISNELFREFWVSYESIRTANTGNELLKDVEFEEIPSPVERSRFQDLPMAQFQMQSTRLDFFQNLREWDEGRISRIARYLPEFEVESLYALSRFRELCGNLPSRDKKLTDIFHLWTAERSGVPYFLTFDKKFINYMTETARLWLYCCPVLPSVLCEILDRDSDAR